MLHTEKSSLNIVKSTQISIEKTVFKFIQHQTECRLVTNESEKRNYNFKKLV